MLEDRLSTSLGRNEGICITASGSELVTVNPSLDLSCKGANLSSFVGTFRNRGFCRAKQSCL